MMRALLSTVVIGAIALAPVFAQQREAEEASISWAETLREFAELETRLGLGLVPAEETKETVRILVERGDQLLGGYAESQGGDALAIARKAVMSATEDAVVAVREGKVRLAAAETPPGVIVDPWAGIDQECSYVPKNLGRIMMSDGRLLPDVDQGDLPRLIPARYRLAEALGLGHNRVLCEPKFFDSIQAVHPGGGGDVVVVARLYCEFTGQFIFGVSRVIEGKLQLSPIQAAAELKPGASGVVGAAEDALPEATFRSAVFSRGRLLTGGNRMSGTSELGMSFEVENSNLTNLVTDGRPGNPWVNEALPAAAAQRGWMIELVQGDPASGECRVRGALCEKLQGLKAAVVRELLADPTVRDRLAVLEKSRKIYQSALQDAVANYGENGDLQMIAESDLLSINLGALVASGSVDDRVLGRIGPATEMALDSAWRVVQVAKTPQALRSQAGALAESLNSVARWILR